MASSGGQITAALIPGTQATDVEVAAAVLLGQQTLVGVNPQTDDYTLVLGDAGKIVTLSNADPKTLTVPTNASVAFVIPTIIHLAQIGAGQYTVAAAGGVTVNGTPTLKFRAQHSGATLIKIATNTWQLFGDLAVS